MKLVFTTAPDLVPALIQYKFRVTRVICINPTGTDKLPLLLIGKSAEPRWLIKKPDEVVYTSTLSAWMTTATYQDWLRVVDQAMRAQRRYILLLVDNASSHYEEGVDLTNVQVAKLPPSTTPKIQPLDRSIFYCVKRDVLRGKMENALDRIDAGELDPCNVGCERALSGAARPVC
jgi:hypothetical protein